MKTINRNEIDQLPGRRMGPTDAFSFRCHSGLACFNQCCRNLNLFLYPYDVIRLKTRLGISSDEFLDRHVDVVLRPDNHFPDVLLRMAENPEKTCPFLSEEGCMLYADRPDTCRNLPVEKGVFLEGPGRPPEMVYFFRPPDFCLGRFEDQPFTPETWTENQDAGDCNRQTVAWMEVKALFLKDPWGMEGPNGPKAKMAFMAAYNIDAFREFIFKSSFRKRYHVKADLLKKIQKDDVALLRFGLKWIKFFVFGIPAGEIRLR